SSATTAGSLTSYLSTSEGNSEGRYVSADGRYVVYQSEAQDLVGGFVDGNGTSSWTDTDVYLFDRLSGINVLVSRTSNSPMMSGNNGSGVPTVSGDGRFVAFASSATDLISGFLMPSSGNTSNIY